MLTSTTRLTVVRCLTEYVGPLQSYLRQVFDDGDGGDASTEEGRRCFTLGIDSSNIGTVLGETRWRSHTPPRGARGPRMRAV